jgi:hypothetical protein
VAEASQLYEVKIPPGLSEESMSNLMNLYQEIQGEKQKKAQDNAGSLDLWGLLDLSGEKYLGSFIARDYQLLLPTPRQYEMLVGSYQSAGEFVRRYPLGLDLVRMVTIPYLLVVTILLMYFIVLVNLSELGDYCNYLLTKFFPSKSNCRLEIVVFEYHDRGVIPWARVELVDRQDYEKRYIGYTNRQGQLVIWLARPGEYDYEVTKDNFTHYFSSEVGPAENYLNSPVVRGAMVVSENGTRQAIAMSAQIDRQRLAKLQRTNWLYGLNVWVMQNLYTLLFIGTSFVAVWLVIGGEQYIWLYAGLLAVSYFVYYFFCREEMAWGTVRNQRGQAWPKIRLELWEQNNLVQTVWSDWLGKYKFTDLPAGSYSLRVAEPNWRLADNDRQFYSGREFAYDPTILCLRKMDLKIRQREEKVINQAVVTTTS